MEIRGLLRAPYGHHPRAGVAASNRLEFFGQNMLMDFYDPVVTIHRAPHDDVVSEALNTFTYLGRHPCRPPD